MQTQIDPRWRDTALGQTAEAILRKCVHCGFCTATCPTYQLLGDELDGPRGRIYLIKQVLEGTPPTRKTQQHLDRCLTCRSCESTCPSGVQYGHLIDIGRALVEQAVERPLGERLLRSALRSGLSSPLFGPAMRLGQAVRPLLARTLQAKVPERRASGDWPAARHPRRVILLAGCVQPSMSPNINTATARVFDAAGLSCAVAAQAGCCGAVKLHLADEAGALAQMRANIDAWTPLLDAGAEGLVINASGCGATVQDYAHLLRDDPTYAARAQRISAATRDLSEWLPELAPRLKPLLQPSRARIVWHPPCSLQHGMQVRGLVERWLPELGFDLRPNACEAHLCCGSAGTYSVLQPALASTLRTRKLAHLHASQPGGAELIASANIGCITHLQAATDTPVRHWIELLDAALHA